MNRAVAATLEDLRTGDAARVEAARDRLEALGPEALHPLRGALRARSERVRIPVALLLVAAAAEDPAVLGSVLDSADYHHRFYEDPGLAAEVSAAITELRAPLERLLPELLRDLSRPDPEVHSRAARRLEAVAHFLGTAGGREDEVAEALLRAMEDDCAEVRGMAALSLPNLGSDPSRVLPPLVALLGDPAGQVRLWTLEALRTLAGAAAGAAPAVAALVRDPDPQVGLVALQSLAVLGAQGPMTEAALARMRDPDPSFRATAFSVLGHLRDLPGEAEAVLREAAARDPVAECRESAARALASSRVRRDAGRFR